MKVVFFYLTICALLPQVSTNYAEFIKPTKMQLNNGDTIQQEYYVPESKGRTYEQIFSLENIIDVCLNTIGYALRVFLQFNYINKFNPHELWTRLSVPTETYMDFVQICEHHGYVTETHQVVTKDGYINTLHRVYKRGDDDGVKDSSSTNQQRKPVILMSHGIEDSSDIWVMSGPDRAPALVAADKGYDVWASNTRGNYYSQGHLWLDFEQDEEYWNHSFVEKARYDIPAFILYIREYLEMDQEEKLVFVGHSQGSQEIFMAVIFDPEFYNRNLKGIVTLSPIAQLSIMNKWLEIPVAILMLITDYNYFFGFFNPRVFISELLLRGCQIWRDTCMMGADFSFTKKAYLVDYNLMRTFFGHYPATSSFKTWKHWGQLYMSGKYQEFDYGPDRNVEIYGQSSPPQIDITKFRDAKIPLVMYITRDDTVVFPEDSQRIKNQLGDAVTRAVYMDGGHMMYFLMRDPSSYLESFFRYIEEFDQIN